MITAEPLQLVTLYGHGAIVIHDDKREYRPADGAIAVPPQLVTRVLGMGFSLVPPAMAPVLEEIAAEVEADILGGLGLA